MKKKQKIDSNHLSFVCPRTKSDFQQVDGEYFCDQCQRQIFDLTDCTVEETAAIQRREGSICGIVRAAGIASLLSLTSCGSTDKGHEGPLFIGTVTPQIPQSVLDDIEEERNRASESGGAGESEASE